MTLAERLRLIVAALPSDSSAVTFTRADLAALIEGSADDVGRPDTRDLTVAEVAQEVGRATGTVRGWLIAGELKGGYKLNAKTWRVPRAALTEYLANQADPPPEPPQAEAVDLGAWRRIAS